MPRKIFFTSLFCIMTSASFCQDILVFRENGSELKTKVLEITDAVIKYKKWDNLDGPTYSIPITTISRITYKNGQQDVFDVRAAAQSETAAVSPPPKKSSMNNYDSAAGYPKVPMVNVPFYLDYDNSKITELETAEFKLERQRAGIWGKSDVKSIPGVASNVRFSKKKSPKFIIQLDDAKSNPFSVCELNLCEVEARREFIDAKKGMHGVEKQSGVKLSFEKLNDTGLYLITVAENLSKGEYFFSIVDQSDVYAFGIDK